MKSFITIILVLLISHCVYSQCQDYHLNSSYRPTTKELSGMSLSNQSKSHYFEARKSHKFQLTLFGQMDYKLLFSTEQKFHPVNFVITEKETGITLYDNKSDDYADFLDVTIKNTTIVIVEVTLLAKDADFKNNSESRSCAGLSVLYKNSAPTGI